MPKFPGFKVGTARTACRWFVSAVAATPSRTLHLQVHKLLGKGSYGKVYKVERDSDKQLYALKEADLGSMSQAERADAVNEVRLLVSISHHNVVSIYPMAFSYAVSVEWSWVARSGGWAAAAAGYRWWILNPTLCSPQLRRATASAVAL